MAAPLIDQAIEHLRDLIVRGDLEPGSKLPPEQELAVMLGCSRSTAREAVRSLVMARVLDVRRGDGTYVTSLRPELLLEGIGFAVDLMRDESLPELWEVRMLLEPAATAKAAETISEDRLAELAEILEQMRRYADDEAVLVRHDARFHELVAEAAGNSTIASLLGSMSSRTLRARVWRGIREAGVSEATVLQHAEILSALQARDPKMAHAAAVLHIGASQAWFRQNVYPEQRISLPGRNEPRSAASSAMGALIWGCPRVRAEAIIDAHGVRQLASLTTLSGRSSGSVARRTVGRGTKRAPKVAGRHGHGRDTPPTGPGLDRGRRVRGGQAGPTLGGPG
jgi:GntR family transcriptional regulator, transcriptional repressor for pyruvate dehydrogenase complex